MSQRYGVYGGGYYYHYTPNINLYSSRFNSGYYNYNQINQNRDYSIRQHGNYYWQYYSNINSMSFEDKQRVVGKSVPSNTQTVVYPQMFETDGEFITYTVRYGDTIWDIVKMYDNVTTSQVLVLNNISDPEKIKVGQKLKIKKKS